ncbi:hypothetical protein ARMGADRAFT_1049111 [Armillaria gallica]|uniref:Uncharacterized protein n=1 Tax=Armillaria gallica TaxID=47427 RepID=A0A2H3C9P4_ARMGA|nr:hypothetical protein ARMGADRAFT_1049111 [Armillaria gallica]
MSYLQVIYKACTAADIGFLWSRICTQVENTSDIMLKQFRNVSIITIETGQELVHFYSEDSIMDAPTSNARHKNKSKVIKLTAKLQRHLWNVRPCDNNKHIPGKLSVCKGLPMMIRLNSAMELAMTKGQECTVHSWVEATGSRGQKILETLFITLSSPPQDVKVPGLPLNVVSLICTSQAITSYLSDDSSISISRSQVKIIPNFAMMDYCLQGKPDL